MSRLRETPFLSEVSPKADDENTLSVLWNAVVGRIKEPINDLIVEFRRLAAGVDTFESGKVGYPCLSRPSWHGRIGQLEDYVVKITCETTPEESLDVFKNETARTQLPNGSHGFGEHVAFIAVGTMFAAKREGLAGRAACHHVYILSQVVVMNPAHVLSM
jgi:hypothetical protein